MNVNYDFNDNDDTFEYDVDVTEYIKEKCSAQDLLKIAQDYWNDGMSDEDKKQYIEDGITEINSSTSADDISDIVSEIDDDWFYNNRYDEIKDAYEDEAIEAYEDSKAYKSDPLGYYGMSMSDFI